MAQRRTFTEVNKRIADLTIQLNKLLAEYKKLEAEGKSSTEINEKLAKSIESVSKKLGTLSNVTRQYNKQQGTSAQQRKETNAALEKAVKAHTNLTGAINKTRKEEEKASQSNKSFGEGLASVFSPSAIGRAIGSVTKFVAIYTVLQKSVDAVREVLFGSIKTFVDYEDSLGKLTAVTGATTAQTNLMSEAIRQSAIQTRFTATEVTDLATSLAKLGATSEEIPDLILPIALAAQAIGADLESTGEAIFKVNNQFSLSSKETAATAQILVGAINDSALSLDSFGTAIQYVGPLATQIGLTFNETASFMQVLADNGFKASRIGTGLRKIFIDLKKPGEDLTDTLKNLAQQNISVAEANELVGKTAAAQLITLLRNIDAFEQNSTSASRLTASLRASAAQMSTTAGIVDILKSSYEDLKISIGGALTNSELFTEAIGLIFPKAEELIRGYKGLNEVFSTEKGTEVAKKELGDLADAAIASGKSTLDAAKLYKASSEIFKQTQQAPELLNLFDRLKKSGFDYAQSLNIVEIATKKGRTALADFLQAIGAGGQKTFEVNQAFKATGLSLEELGDQFVKYEGFTKIVADQTKEVIKAKKIEEERTNTFDSFAEQIERIKALGPTTTAADVQSQELLLEVQKKLRTAQEQLNEEQQRGIIGDEEKILQLTGQVSGYQKVINALSEFGDVDDEEIKRQKKAREERARLDVDDIKRRRAQIKEELARIKQIRDEEIKTAEERAKLQGEAAKTAQERAKVEEALNESIAASNQKASELIGDALGKLGPLYDDATIAVNKFGDEFPQLVQDLQDSIGDLSDLFADLADDIDETFAEKANDAIGDAKKVLATYKKQVEELNDKFGENAGKTEEYFDALKLLTGGLSEELVNIADGLDRSTAEGEAAYRIIIQLLNKVKQSAQAPEGDAFDWKEFWKETLVDSLQDAVNRAADALNKFNDVALENTKNRLEAQRDAIKASADIENDILRSQLENQLITEEEFRNRSEQNRKREIARQNQIDKQIFDAEQKRDRQQARTDFLEAVASAVINEIRAGNPLPAALISGGIAAAFAGASYAAELNAINQRQFFPKRFAEGGIVNGPSHAEGGIPFTVQGRGGYEMEGGEFIVNKRAASQHRSLLERINSSAKPNSMAGSRVYDSNPMAIRKFASGGSVTAEEAARATDLQLEYLRAIAESNVAVAQNTNKPVRAFITQTDLRNNDLERRIVNKNSRL